jgi:hypothetical protein
MNPMNPHLTRKQRLLVSLMLGLVVLSSVSPFLRPNSSSASSSLLPTGSVTSWAVVGTGSQNPQFSIALGETAHLPVTLPTIIYVNAWLTYDGQVYWSGSYAIAILGGQSSGSTIINAPYLGTGDYVFYASLSLGHLIAIQTIVDPRIDPNW